MQTNEQNDWQTIAQASLKVGKTRQAIENLTKKGIIEVKQIGEKNINHVFMPSLLMYYASKHVDANCIQNNSKFEANDLKTELALANAECKRLSDLLAIYEKNLAKVEYEYAKEREKNDKLNSDVLTLTKEYRALINNEEGLSNIIYNIFKGRKK